MRDLTNLLSIPGITKDQARHVALTKLAFDGDVSLAAAAPPAEPDPLLRVQRDALVALSARDDGVRDVPPAGKP